MPHPHNRQRASASPAAGLLHCRGLRLQMEERCRIFICRRSIFLDNSPLLAFRDRRPTSDEYKQRGEKKGGRWGRRISHTTTKTRSGNTPAVMAHRRVCWCQGWQLVCVCSAVCLVVPTCPETGGVQIEQGEHQAPHQEF